MSRQHVSKQNKVYCVIQFISQSGIGAMPKEKNGAEEVREAARGCQGLPQVDHCFTIIPCPLVSWITVSGLSAKNSSTARFAPGHEINP